MPITKSYLAVGNFITLDFANTIHHNALKNTADLSRFGRQFFHILPLFPSKVTTRDLQRALLFRKLVRASIIAIIHNEEVKSEWIEKINDLLKFANPVLTRTSKDWELNTKHPSGFTKVLVILAQDFGELLTKPRQRLRKCANPDCPILFYDTSKAGKRRWCSMNECGNRNKVATYYRRRHI